MHFGLLIVAFLVFEPRGLVTVSKEASACETWRGTLDTVTAGGGES